MRARGLTPASALAFWSLNFCAFVRKVPHTTLDRSVLQITFLFRYPTREAGSPRQNSRCCIYLAAAWQCSFSLTYLLYRVQPAFDEGVCINSETLVVTVACRKCLACAACGPPLRAKV